MNYKVRQGDTIGSIAKRFGLFPEDIWNDPANEQIKSERKNPNILVVGDILFIRNKEMQEKICTTEQRHLFVVKNARAKFKLRLLDDDENPRSNIDYILNIDGKVKSGTTDSEGMIETEIPPDAERAKLTVEGVVTELPIGYIDPIDTLSGAQARLRNLGYNCGNIDGKMGGKTKLSIMEFQEKHGLPATGELDKATLEKVEEIHMS